LVEFIRQFSGNGGPSEEADMVADPKHKSPRADADREQRERRRRQDEALDEALKDTFPASDPVSAEQPVAP
jgi:nicotinate phosphoribosyltransferase